LCLGKEDSLLIFHHGTHWEYGMELFRSARSKFKLLRYHNVTLSECFLDYPAGYLDATVTGRFDTTRLANMAGHVAAPSYWAMGDLVACGADPSRLHYLPFVHDLDAFERMPPSESVLAEVRREGHFKLLTLGRQVPSKGLHHALEVLRHYRDRFGSHIVLFIVGGRDALHEAYHRGLDKFIARHALESNVVFRPEASRSDVAAFLRACDALLTMSESDAACIPILEAGRLGKPILGLARGGKAEQAGSLDYGLHALSWHPARGDRGAQLGVDLTGLTAARPLVDEG